MLLPWRLLLFQVSEDCRWEDFPYATAIHRQDSEGKVVSPTTQGPRPFREWLPFGVRDSTLQSASSRLCRQAVRPDYKLPRH